MMIDLGGGTLPHPRADVVIALHHPRHAPAQAAAVTPWTVDGGDADTVNVRRIGLTPGLIGGPTRLIHHLKDGTVDEVYASHFMEHIHRGQPLIEVMNEAWRVLRPGGTFTMILPLVGFTDAAGNGQMVAGWQPYADPTHVNLWWFPEALLYFCDGPFKPHANYGIHVWGALGPEVDEAQASFFIDGYRTTPAYGPASFWAVRGGWEGVARLVKP